MYGMTSNHGGGGGVFIGWGTKFIFLKKDFLALMVRNG
jgi:hypothetical protein